MSKTRRDFLQDGLLLAAMPRFAVSPFLSSAGSQEELWYAQPAERWLQALPVGNGRLGGMVFGGVDREQIALSESTAWSGAPSDDDVNPAALSHLAEIRRLLFAGEYAQARDLCQQDLLANPKSFGTNLPLPALQFSLDDTGPHTDYRRSLDLDEAVTKASFRRKGTLFSREVFSSHPDGVLVARFTCAGPSRINLRAAFGDLTIPADITTDSDGTLILRGHAFEKMHSTGSEGVALQIRARVMAEGGHVAASGQSVQVEDARAVTVLIAVATDYQGVDPEKACAQQVARAARKSYAQLRSDHVADHQALYRRVSLQLGANGARADTRPTDVRRKALANGASDPDLVALFFQYGRYLTIAGSREDSPLPLALQGIWNDGLASSMGWTDDYHLDVNTQQNYWAAEVANLGECQTPLFGLIDGLRVAGARTAEKMYGAPGWVCHTVTNAWGYTAPGAGLGWGLFVTAGIWIAQQLWEHYAFSPDVEFLRSRAYPVLRDAAKFFLAYMVVDPKHGWLVTGPSDSPENWYLSPSGERCAESMGDTVDRVFVYALFTWCIEGSKTLGVDQDLRQQLENARAKLPPFQIGSHGQLQEWLEDFQEGEPNHRHTSHLAAVYPEDQISPRTTPELAQAAEVTIQRRITAPHWEQSEWGRANLAIYSARLLKPDAAHTFLVSLIAQSADDNLLSFSSAGVAGADQNIFSLDGNTAGAAAIAEMLLQSQGGEIHLLPALPDAWPDGAVRGLCARGGFEVNLAWRRGALRSATITSKRGGASPVLYRHRTVQIHLQPGEAAHLFPADFNHGESSTNL